VCDLCDLINMEPPFRIIELNKRTLYLGNSTQSYVNEGEEEPASSVVNGTLHRLPSPSHSHVPISQSFSTSLKIVVFGAAGLIAFLVIISLALYVYRRMFVKKKQGRAADLESSDSTWSDKTLKGDEEERIRSSV